MEFTNGTCVKYFMAPKDYKVVKTHAREIPAYTILSIILHACVPNLGGMNGDVKYDLSTLEFKNGKKIADFHIRIIRIQQEIILY